MKKGLLKRLSAVILAAVLAVGLAPVAGNITNGAVGSVEANAAEIRVTEEVVNQLYEEVNAFEEGSLTGEVLFQNVTAIIDDEDILARINAAYEPYVLSKTQLKDTLLEYCDLIMQTVEVYRATAASNITLPIIFNNTIIKKQSVMLGTSASINITLEELEAYANNLRALTDWLEQGYRLDEIKALLASHSGWFESDEYYSVILERIDQYVTDRNTYVQVIRDALDYLMSLLEEDPGTPEEPGEEEIVLTNPRIETTTDENGQSVQKTTWDCIYFGSYPQSDVTGKTTEPIKWRVLAVNGDDAMLLADMILDGQPYNSGGTNATWSTCALRTWLNNDFLNTAFSSVEQEAISTTTLVNEKNPTYGTSGGSRTYDKIYLLSIVAATTKDYGFVLGTTRLAKNTNFAANKMYSSASANGYGDWWLRSPGYYANGAAYVGDNGYVDQYGSDNSDRFGVRPVLHMNLSKEDVWTYAGMVCSDGTVQEPVVSHTHVWDDGYTVDKPATCIEEGSESIHCSVCGEIKEGSSRAIAETEHSYGDWKTTKVATYTEVGIKERECTVCGHTEQAEIPVLEKKGWVKEDDYWYYYNTDGTKATNTWKKDSKGWCYLGADGKMVTNGWAKDSKGWCWMGADGYWVKDKWILDKGEWYYIKSNGYMAANEWAKDSGGWYYMNSSGKIAKNAWAKDSKGWMYMDANGRITKSKWIKSGGYWYYLKSDGYMATGTQKIGGKTYKFDSAGRWIS